MRDLSQIPGLTSAEIGRARKHMQLFRKEFAMLVEKGELKVPLEPALPLDRMRKAVKAEVASSTAREEFVKHLEAATGKKIKKAELNSLYKRALPLVARALANLANPEYGQPHLLLHNLQSDGVFFQGQGRFVWAAPTGVVYAASTDNEEDWDVAAMVMIGSIVVEAIGVVAAIAGIALPTGDTLDRLGVKIWARLTPSQRARFIRFMVAILDARKGVEEKLDLIFKFLKWLHGLGLIHLALNDLLYGSDWLDIALIVLQIGLTLAALLVPGAGAAALAHRVISILNAITTIVRKGKALKKNLESEPA